MRAILVGVSSNPSLYLQELCELVRTATGVSVSGFTVCRLLRRSGFTRNKVQQVAKQRCTDYSAPYIRTGDVHLTCAYFLGQAALLV